MEDLASIVAVAAPSVVALVAIGFAFARQTRDFTHARALADRAELRDRLDECAQALRKAEGVSGAGSGYLLTHGAHLGLASGETLKELKEVSREVELNHERLAIRLGPEHTVVKVHGAARGNLNAAVETLLRVASMPPATIEATDQIKESWDVLEEALSSLAASRETFVGAAVALVGTDLGPQDARWSRHLLRRRRRRG